MPRIHDFKDNVISRFETFDDGIELILCSRRLLVDTDDHETGLKALKIGERTSLNGLDDYAGGMNLLGSLVGDLANDEAELLARVAGAIRVRFWFLSGEIREDLIAVANRYGGILRLSIAHEAEADAGAGPAAGNVADEIVAILDAAAVDGGDDVAGFDASLIGWSSGLYLLDQNPVLEAINAVHGSRKAGAERDSDGSAGDLVAGANEVVVHRNDRVGGHCESDALIASGLGVDGGVDADDFAVHVEQRASGIAGIDGSIRLEEVLELACNAGLDGAVFGGDDAGGDSLSEGKGAADGFNPVPNLGLIGISHFYGWERGTAVDFDDREIRSFVGADDAGGTAEILRVRIAGKLDEDLVGFFDHVVIGDDVALGVDDEARTQRLANLSIIAAVTLIRYLSTEEAVEEVLEIVLTLTALVLIIVVRVVAGVLRVGLDAVVRVRQEPAAAFIAGVFRQRLGIDIDHCGSHGLGNFYEGVGLSGRIAHLERRGVAAVARSFLTANSMGRVRSADNRDGQNGEEKKCGGETVRAQSCV